MVHELMKSVLKVANLDRANIVSTVLEQSPQVIARNLSANGYYTLNCYSSLQITKKTNSDHHIQQSHSPEKNL
jgi:hypothetical protein